MATVESMTKALKLQRNISVSGPYFEFSRPYGYRTKYSEQLVLATLLNFAIGKSM